MARSAVTRIVGGVSRVALVAAGGSALALSACGSSQRADVVRLNPLAQVVSKTSAAKSAKIDLHAAMTVPGAGQFTLAGTGAMDLVAGRGTMSMRTLQAIPGLGMPLQMDEVIDRRVIFVRLNGFPGGALGGKHWLELNLDKLSSSSGLDLGGALQSAAGSSNPTDALQWLRGASDVKKVGTDVIRGERTDHYRAVIALADVAAKVPPSQRAQVRREIQQLRKLGAPARVPTDVWVGRDGLLRRQAMSLQQTLPRGGGRMGVRMTIDLHDYGTPVSVRRPPASDVFDLSAQVGSALQRDLGR
jgi:hypothetical protein